MKVVILAGGLGTRLAEFTSNLPKPMVEIGGKPLLWHIMKIYSYYGFNEFVIALGYKSEAIKSYFLNFYALDNDLSVDLSTGTHTIHETKKNDWIVHLVDTGLNTQTGGRILSLRDWIQDEPFMLTYGDGVANVNIRELVEFHQNHGKLATVTAVHPPARFGALSLEGNQVTEFSEKNQIKEGWVNGGFFVLEPEIFNYISDENAIWEKASMENLAKTGELVSFFHNGFWQPVDTLREYQVLQSLWSEKRAPWNVWDQLKAVR